MPTKSVLNDQLTPEKTKKGTFMFYVANCLVFFLDLFIHFF